MIKDLLDIGHAKDVLDLLTEDDVKGMATDEHKLHNEHWSDEPMRTAAMGLKKMLKKRKGAVDGAEGNKKKRRRRYVG